jgi:diguanylate cyclase (GGDEF)-like protein
MLAAVGRHLSRTLRSTDIKCRYGGDEFLIILPDTPLAGAERAADALVVDIGLLQIRCDATSISPTISIGVAVSEDDEVDALVLVARADAALYRAKQLGRNRYSVGLPTDSGAPA